MIRHGKLAALVTSAAAAAALLTLGAAPQAGAADLPLGVTFYTGSDRTGTAMSADLDEVGVCQELSAPALSYLAISQRNVDVFFNPDCQTGAPGQSGDLYYRTGTFNGGDFPYPALSFRVHADAN
ncbi:hypothetical protein [Streptomyces palmae]|uniref:Beta/gamma crystallin 'Greek key' domain-containing protein n=1 Tax=Streptomyces palmae TaxID=1701085 RepID=A0A4Z0HIP5_9ACTN|nr:hypothetical protein [Streptomyces palmae]TGB17386.1 hypothetical protein E4099_03640 [Streptomyces palmae]